MSWTTFRLQVMTPLFSGDDPSPGNVDSPIRIPSIRGVLRYWFRAVAAGHGIVDRKALWEAEEKVFGSTKHPSPIQLRLVDGPTASGVGSRPTWTGGRGRKGFHGAHYLLGQGLWKYGSGLIRPYVAPDVKFELQVRLSEDETIDRQFLLATWAWLTYGGMGARTRRGFGQLRCIGVDGQLPLPFSSALKAVHTPAKWRDLLRTAVPSELRRPAEIGWSTWSEVRPSDAEQPPELPMLAPRWWAGRLFDDHSGSLEGALNVAGQKWRNFRAVSNPDATPTPNTHSPEWVNAIHGNDRRYPVAALGLPVGYFSKEKNDRPEFKAAVEPCRPSDSGDEPESLRRASPVWLRPVQLEDRSWRVFTHVFRARLLPEDSQLHIVEDGVQLSSLDVPDSELTKRAWDAWLKGRKRLPHGFYDPQSTAT